MRWLVLTVLLFSLPAQAATQRYPYQGCFEIAATMHQLPLDLLLAVAATESNWDPDARSHANAHGIMQIQWPGTARYLGVQRVAELYNPCLNIELGARYLRELIDRFDKNTDTALAAYNYGPGAIERAKSIPAGAKRYVATVAKHRKRINGGQIPPKLQASERKVLMLFRSKLRAERLAKKLNGMLQGGSASHAQTAAGHSVQLLVGSSGLTMSDRVLLENLGFKL